MFRIETKPCPLRKPTLALYRVTISVFSFGRALTSVSVYTFFLFLLFLPTITASIQESIERYVNEDRKVSPTAFDDYALLQNKAKMQNKNTTNPMHQAPFPIMVFLRKTLYTSFQYCFVLCFLFLCFLNCFKTFLYLLCFYIQIVDERVHRIIGHLRQKESNEPMNKNENP